MLNGGCLTLKMWDARDDLSLVPLPDKRDGKPATETESKFANNCIGLLLTPLTFVADVILFPVQIIGGYRPYGDRRE